MFWTATLLRPETLQLVQPMQQHVTVFPFIFACMSAFFSTSWPAPIDRPHGSSICSGRWHISRVWGDWQEAR